MVRLNYLLTNPVKHSYRDDLHDYSWSSFQVLIAEQGRDTLVQQFKDFPQYKTLILHEAEKDDF